jgi:hypothetical protein
MKTFTAKYETPSGLYCAYLDTSNEKKARNFFNDWEGKLNSKDFPVRLLGIVHGRVAESG